MDRLNILLGDITTLKADAVVNAANNFLRGGGGVDGAIHRKGGPSILQECKQIIEKQGLCKTGEAVITHAGNLPAKYVIHTVGPVWKSGTDNEESLLRNAYFHSLELAAAYNCKHVAFPNISTGVYRFPKKLAAQIAIDTSKEFLINNTLPGKITFVCFDHENYLIYSDFIQ